MKVVLLVCETLHIKTSLSSCGKASVSERAAGTSCKRCPIGAAVAGNKPLPESWPDGKPLEYVPTTVHGTLRKSEALPKRGHRPVA